MEQLAYYMTRTTSDSAIAILTAHVRGDRENGRQIRPACGCRGLHYFLPMWS